jgi:hypothetical protein
MRPVEFAAELVILLAEGPQDKKSSIDLYYRKYREEFPEEEELEERLDSYVRWLRKALPDLGQTRYRKTIDLYALVGALDRISESGESLSQLNARRCGISLKGFESELAEEEHGRDAERYLVAASSQTDNLAPRQTRIDVLERVLTKA